MGSRARFRRSFGKSSLLRRQCAVDGHTFDSYPITHGKYKGLTSRACKFCNRKEIGSFEYKNKKGWVFKPIVESDKWGILR